MPTIKDVEAGEANGGDCWRRGEGEKLEKAMEKLKKKKAEKTAGDFKSNAQLNQWR
tara:strand:+ start:183 stop:350 length:168 start_codon:yes stop_codon:yes gene_type:complete